jgi:6-pyruvoyltetrahydropterin/6-carboxytetrahydropterin synthase
MFSLTVNAEFCAAHALVIAGQREVIHGHNFRVTACIEGNTLDGDGLLCDFHTVESFLHEIIHPFINANLNATPPFDTLNPSAENLAKHLADELHSRLGESLAPAARVSWVSISEAPGCIATYRRG